MALSVSQRALGGVSAPLISRERVVAIALGLVALLLAFLIAHDVLFPAAPTAGLAQTRTVTRGTVRSAVSGTGTVVPASQQNLTFGVAGSLSEVDVKVGDPVKQGQVLAKLDQTTFQNALSQANNNLTTAQSTLNNTVNGNSIMVRTRDGKDLLITVNSDTKYFEITGKKQRQAGKLSDIHAGMQLVAAGRYDASHNFDAAIVAYRNK